MIHQGVKILLTEQGYKAEGFPYTMDSLEKLKRELDWIAAGKSNAWVVAGGRVNVKLIDESAIADVGTWESVGNPIDDINDLVERMKNG